LHSPIQLLFVQIVEMSDQNSGDKQRIGDFEIVRQLGAGGMGIVYLARQLSLNRLCALKVLGGALSHPQYIERFKREAQSVARLKHPNIPAVHFIGQDGRFCYLAMDYIEGVSLRKVISGLARTTRPDSNLDHFVEENDKPERIIRFDNDQQSQETVDFLPGFAADANAITKEARHAIGSKKHVERCVKIVRSIAVAIDHAHEVGIVHRDLKPENVMIGKDGRVYVIDFGVARFLENATLTQTGQIVGTPIYMSPEQVTGRIVADRRTDIYSMGILFYELLTLRPPITAPTRESVLRNIIGKPLQPVSWHNDHIPEQLENIVHKMTAKDADQRYASVGELLADLDRAESGEPVLAPAYRYTADEKEIRAERPNSVIWSAAIMFFYGILGLAGGLMGIVNAFFAPPGSNTAEGASAGTVNLLGAGLSSILFFVASVTLVNTNIDTLLRSAARTIVTLG
jgi:serine/threonine protein kinase